MSFQPLRGKTNQLKQFIKLFVPPVIWQGVRRVFVRRQPSYTYIGKFGSFLEVMNKFPLATTYHSERSEAMEVAESKGRMARYEAGELPDYGPDLSRLNFLSIALSLVPRRTVSILDVGGGLGATFLNLKFSLPTKNVFLTIVELPLIAERGSMMMGGKYDVKFVSNIPNHGEMFDVVYFGSSLQYFEEYEKLFANVAKLSPEYIIISDTTIGPAPSFVCAQINMPGRVIPRVVFNKDELIFIMSTYGYALMHQSVNYYPYDSFDNYDLPARSTLRWNLVFAREH